MPKIFLICGILSCLMILPASGALRCIAVNSDTTCTFNSPEPGQSDWGATCNNIYFYGVSTCGLPRENQNSGAVIDSVYVSGDVQQNTACYCKITQPAVSRWVFAENRSTAGDCAWWCQSACAGKMGDNNNQDSINFRRSMLGELYE